MSPNNQTLHFYITLIAYTPSYQQSVENIRTALGGSCFNIIRDGSLMDRLMGSFERCVITSRFRSPVSRRPSGGTLMTNASYNWLNALLYNCTPWFHNILCMNLIVILRARTN